MDNNNEKIEKKQSYLRKEILDKGYSPEDFANYVKKIKGENGDDLNLWSIEELYYIVFSLDLYMHYSHLYLITLLSKVNLL